MNATARPGVSSQEGVLTRVRDFTIGLIFATILLIPKLLRLRRNARAWKVIRILLAASGAALVMMPLSAASSWVTAVAGLALFVAAILMPAAKPASGVDEKAREVGALVVVNGGEYEQSSAPPLPVKLLVGSERIAVLDSRLQPLLSIPVASISSALAAESQGRWILRIRWADQTSDFVYRGVFAEHFARVAESAIRSVMRSPLPVLQQRRAAGA